MSGAVPKCASWLGHKFAPRYSVGAPTIKPDQCAEAFIFSDAPRVIESSRPKNYEGDVCVRCGLRSDRPAKP